MKFIFVYAIVLALTSELSASPIGIFKMQKEFVNSLVDTMELLIEKRNEMLGNILKTLREEVDAVLGLESATAANATGVLNELVQNLTTSLSSAQNSITTLTQAQNSTTS